VEKGKIMNSTVLRTGGALEILEALALAGLVDDRVMVKAPSRSGDPNDDLHVALVGRNLIRVVFNKLEIHTHPDEQVARDCFAAQRAPMDAYNTGGIQAVLRGMARELMGQDPNGTDEATGHVPDIDIRVPDAVGTDADGGLTAHWRREDS